MSRIKIGVYNPASDLREKLWEVSRATTVHMEILADQNEPASGQKRRRISRLALKLFTEWQQLELPLRDQALVVAVSGGADSVALILAIKELVDTNRIALNTTIAHLNHGLRASRGREDAVWVGELGKSLGLEVDQGNVSVANRAAQSGDNLEQAARIARYEFLGNVARSRGAELIVTGHTMEDQAETILLHLLRGSGAEGLAGIEPVRKLAPNSSVVLVRPLLNWAIRADTHEYCRKHEIKFREDEMNHESRFARVRVRKELIPLMQTFNPRLVPALSRTARLMRDDSKVLEDHASKLLGMARLTADGEVTSGNTAVSVNILSTAEPSIRRRALRLWIAGARGDLKRIELVHILAVEKLLEGQRGGRIALLPGEMRVRRVRGALHLLPKLPKKEIDNASGAD